MIMFSFSYWYGACSLMLIYILLQTASDTPTSGRNFFVPPRRAHDQSLYPVVIFSRSTMPVQGKNAIGHAPSLPASS